MLKAKAARKWHAARQRQVQRIFAAAMARMGDSLADSIRAHGQLGLAMRDAGRALVSFIAETMARRVVRQVIGSMPVAAFESGGFHRGGFVRAGEVPAVLLPPGQLFARAPGGELQHVGTTGPIRLRLGHDPLPDQRVGCTCTVTRMVKTDSQGQPHQVDVRSPPCDWCLDLEDPAAAEGFGLEPIQCCGTCGEPILDDDMTGTTCACARRADPT